MKRRGYEHLTRRLAKRECLAAPPGAVAPQSRRLAENVVPDTPVPGLVPPANTVLHSFTPCGRYLIAFHAVNSEVVAYRFKGLHISSSAAAGGSGAPAAPGAGADASAAGPGQPGQQQQQQRRGQQQARGPSQSSSQASQSAGHLQPGSHATSWGQGQHEQGQPPAAAGSQQAHQGVAQQARQQQVAFGDVFEERWRCCPCPSRREQLSPDFCAVAHGSFLLVCTASPERAPPNGARGAAESVPAVERTTLHLVDLSSGSLLDSHSLRDDFVERGRGQGLHLWGNRLLVLGLATQTLHVLQVLPSGRFLYLHGIGQHCRDDDALVISQQEEAERRLRQRLEQQRQQRQQGRGRGGLSHTTSATSLPALAGSGEVAGAAAAAAGGPGAAGVRLAAAGTVLGTGGAGIGAGGAGAAGPGQPAVPPAAAAAGAAAAQPAAQAAAGLDSDSDAEDSAGLLDEAGEAVLLSGLKQCLLAYLYREALQQAQAAAEAAAAAVPCSGACSEPCTGGPVGLAGAGGSTASLLSAVASGSANAPLPGPGMGGMAAAGGSTSSLGSLATLQQQQVVAQWRRPLDRFCYYFQSYCELVMWKAQVLDEQRLLVHWCPPDVLGATHHRHGHASSVAAHGATGGSYAMLYNLSEARVEHLFVAHSSEFAAWYLEQPAAFCGSSCACGCGAEWERFVSPPGGSRLAREQQQRGLQQAAKELRLRLSDELPASGQLRQTTPYLDPDLYCFDERSVGGPIRPHHPPHRPLKFMARCHPERLRFRLDPEHLAAGAGGAQGGRGAARARHLVYLFHPVQPFLLVATQDVESGVAEHLTLFTRL